MQKRRKRANTWLHYMQNDGLQLIFIKLKILVFRLAKLEVQCLDGAQVEVIVYCQDKSEDTVFSSYSQSRTRNKVERISFHTKYQSKTILFSYQLLVETVFSLVDDTTIGGILKSGLIIASEEIVCLSPWLTRISGGSPTHPCPLCRSAQIWSRNRTLWS